jgi:hypothetical protein
VDTSDYHALVAPRPIVVETGLIDWSYSTLATPFAGDKQVLRRSRAAYGQAESWRIIHYLHADGHAFHTAADPTGSTGFLGIEVARDIAPHGSLTVGWQLDAITAHRRMTVFDIVTTWVR